MAKRKALKGQKEISEKVKEVSEGLISRALDLVLLSIFYGFEFGMGGYGKTSQADERAYRALSELNYSTIKRSIKRLNRRGLIQSMEKAREEYVLPRITKEGKKRLRQIVPQYRKRRTWDGRIYMVTYDIPRERNQERNRLREYLKKIGCGMLQHRVWLTPYNPQVLVGEFVERYGLHGLILVSTLRKEGAVGQMELPDLMERVYKLDELNERYDDFNIYFKQGKYKKEQAIFTYLSILGDDPQIPFELLPTDWQGDEAYKIYRSVIS